MSAAPERDPVEAYLDRLLLQLGGRATDVRRVLAEAEEHLRDAQAEAEVRGLSPEQAAREAVLRFGSPATVARSFRPPGGLLPGRAMLVQLMQSLWLVGTAGLLAIGAGGGLTAVLGAVFGKAWVAADPPGIASTPARCAEYLRLEPHARSCEAAAIAHHFGELVFYQGACGVLGLMALVAFTVARRAARGRWDLVGMLPDGFAATVGAALFGVAAAALLFQSVGQLAISGAPGAGAALGQGIAAAAGAAWFGRTLLRVLAVRGASALPAGDGQRAARGAQPADGRSRSNRRPGV